MSMTDASNGLLPAEPEAPVEGGPFKSFLGHLEDLRRLLLRSAAIVAVLFCAALAFAPQLFAFLKWPLRRATIDPDHFLLAFTVTGGIQLWMQMAFWASIVASAPLLLALWTNYLLPALKKHERQMLVRGMVLGALLFLAGAALAFLVLLPPTLRVMLDIYAWLGIPVTWEQIAGARVIVEAGLKDIKVTPSQGSHFFQNLTSFRVGFFTINEDDGFIDWDWLAAAATVKDSGYVRRLHFENPLMVAIDGKRQKGVILKPASTETE